MQETVDTIRQKVWAQGNPTRPERMFLLEQLDKHSDDMPIAETKGNVISTGRPVFVGYTEYRNGAYRSLVLLEANTQLKDGSWCYQF